MEYSNVYRICLFIHLLMDICFHFLAALNSDALNIHIQVFQYFFSILGGKYLRVELPGHLSHRTFAAFFHKDMNTCNIMFPYYLKIKISSCYFKILNNQFIIVTKFDVKKIKVLTLQGY